MIRHHRNCRTMRLRSRFHDRNDFFANCALASHPSRIFTGRFQQLDSSSWAASLDRHDIGGLLRTGYFVPRIKRSSSRSPYSCCLETMKRSIDIDSLWRNQNSWWKPKPETSRVIQYLTRAQPVLSNYLCLKTKSECRLKRITCHPKFIEFQITCHQILH